MRHEEIKQQQESTFISEARPELELASWKANWHPSSLRKAWQSKKTRPQGRSPEREVGGRRCGGSGAETHECMIFSISIDGKWPAKEHNLWT